MQTFNSRSGSSCKCINNIVKQFREFGTAVDKERSGRPRTVRCEATAENVYDDVKENPTTSLRKRSNKLTLLPDHWIDSKTDEILSIQDSTHE